MGLSYWAERKLKTKIGASPLPRTLDTGLGLKVRG